MSKSGWFSRIAAVAFATLFGNPALSASDVQVIPG